MRWCFACGAPRRRGYWAARRRPPAEARMNSPSGLTCQAQPVSRADWQSARCLQSRAFLYEPAMATNHCLLHTRPDAVGIAGCVQKQLVRSARAFVSELTTREPAVWLRLGHMQDDETKDAKLIYNGPGKGFRVACWRIIWRNYLGIISY